mgnify:CR=1 FL=1
MSLPTPYPISPRHRGKLAINVLKATEPLDTAAVEEFLATHQVPIVEGAKFSGRTIAEFFQKSSDG